MRNDVNVYNSFSKTRFQQQQRRRKDGFHNHNIQYLNKRELCSDPHAKKR